MKRLIGSMVAVAGIAGLTSAQAAVPIQFNPNGGGAGTVTIMTFDWLPGNAVQIRGNPAGGVTTATKPLLLTQSKLGVLVDANGAAIALPSGVEFTFVGGFPEKTTSADAATKSYSYALDTAADATAPNFFEIWVGPPNANMLAGTGFNDLSPDHTTAHRILFGQVTAATGNFTQLPCSGGASTTQFDQFVNLADDDYNGLPTVCGVGSTDISVNLISVDVNYFPGFTPAVVATTKAFFNTSTVVPFKQTNPSRLFVDDDAGADGLSPPVPSIMPSLLPVNGGLQGAATLDFQTQADANQSFELGEAVSGACRVTYGGNDQNGNVDLTKFGQACSSDKSPNKQNCYTFGGQVGAPTADPAFNGPFGEHTHHQVQGPAGDFVFRAGTHSAPKNTRITATACKDPGACRQAEANAGFKQIDFEGTGSFRTLDAVAKAYLIKNGAPSDIAPDNVSDRTYYFRVDMDDNGEPGSKASSKKADITACSNFLAADLNQALGIADPTLNSLASCSACADVYQFYVCKDEHPCEQSQAIYAVRGFLTGGNIQLHQVIK